MPRHLDSVYVTYWSLLDPLCQSQSLPYLLALTREGYRIGLVTFEQRRWRLSRKQQNATQEELSRHGIEWRPLRYHKWPPVLSTVYDICIGGMFCARFAQRRGASLVHGRSSVSCAVATIAARFSGVRLFADADGPLSQEYVDAGVWKEGSFGHRLTAWGERQFIERADVVGVLTKHRKAEVAKWAPDTPVHILPCAVDLERFRPLPIHRTTFRRDLGLQGTVFVYAGKAGGWYDTEGMIDFLKVAKHAFGALTLLVLTREEPSKFEELCARAGIKLVVRSAQPAEVPAYLNAADVGLCFRHRLPSQLSCSPIKLAEYLASGLPVVSTSGCGDYDELIQSERVGIVVGGDSVSDYRRAAASLNSLLSEEFVQERCRSCARRFLGLREVVVPRYLDIYRDFLSPTRA